MYIISFFFFFFFVKTFIDVSLIAKQIGWSTTGDEKSSWRNWTGEPSYEHLQWDRSWSRTWQVHGTFVIKYDNMFI